MALIVLCLFDTPEGPAFDMKSEPGFNPSDIDKLTPAQLLAAEIMRNTGMVPEPEPQEESKLILLNGHDPEIQH